MHFRAEGIQLQRFLSEASDVEISKYRDVFARHLGNGVPDTVIEPLTCFLLRCKSEGWEPLSVNINSARARIKFLHGKMEFGQDFPLVSSSPK